MTTKVRERPIIFSTPMTQAILAGRKSQTRRICKGPKSLRHAPSGSRFHEVVGRNVNGELDDAAPRQMPDWAIEELLKECPYEVGMRLWVRENFRETEDIDGREVMEYQAGGTRLIVEVGGRYEIAHGEHRCTSIAPRWRPSIHMPRWASRITLEITEVRVQRVQEISWEDAATEGVDAWGERKCPGCFHDGQCSTVHPPGGPCGVYVLGYVDEFKRLWNSIHGAGAWEHNDFVLCLSFRRV